MWLLFNEDTLLDSNSFNCVEINVNQLDVDFLKKGELIHRRCFMLPSEAEAFFKKVSEKLMNE